MCIRDRVLESIVVAFSMYSKIPMPHIEWNKENMKNVLCFFPWVGAVAGVLVWLWFLVSDQLGFGVMLRASVAVLIPVLVTGGIHLDGLLATADALSSWQTRERRLEILKMCIRDRYPGTDENGAAGGDRCDTSPCSGCDGKSEAGV